MSDMGRQVAELVGFVTYSGGLVAFVESSPGWPRWLAAFVMMAGVVLMGQTLWVRSKPGN